MNEQNHTDLMLKVQGTWAQCYRCLVGTTREGRTGGITQPVKKKNNAFTLKSIGIYKKKKKNKMEMRNEKPERKLENPVQPVDQLDCSFTWPTRYFGLAGNSPFRALNFGKKQIQSKQWKVKKKSIGGIHSGWICLVPVGGSGFCKRTICVLYNPF